MWCVFHIIISGLSSKFVIQESSLCQLSYKSFLLKFGYEMKKLWAFFSALLFLPFLCVFFFFLFSCFFYFWKTPLTSYPFNFIRLLTLEPFILCFILIHLSIRCICHGLFLRAKIDFTHSPPPLNCISLHYLSLTHYSLSPYINPHPCCKWPLHWGANSRANCQVFSLSENFLSFFLTLSSTSTLTLTLISLTSTLNLFSSSLFFLFSRHLHRCAKLLALFVTTRRSTKGDICSSI